MTFQLGQLGWMGRGLGSIDHIAGVPNQGSNPPRVIFSLPLADAGAGAVNTTPTINGGSGTPTFTRASVAWTKLSTGLWASVASGTARSCYLGANTAVGTYGGFFSEAAAAQLVTPDASIRDMTNAAWVAGATMTVAKTATGIDGAANACTTLTGGAVSATNTIFQTLTAAASSRTYSCWIRRRTGTGTINITQDAGASYTDVTSQINGSTFTRVSLTASQLNAAFGIQVVTSTDAIDVDFNQFETGTAATSPMATSGSVRAIDSLTYATAGNIVAAAGTCFIESAYMGKIVTNPGVGGVAQNWQLNRINTATQALIFDGTNAVSKNGLTFTDNVSAKMGCSWGGVTMSLTAGGVAAGNGAFDGDMTGGDATFTVGGNMGLASNACHKNLVFYSGSLSDANLATMTT